MFNKLRREILKIRAVWAILFVLMIAVYGSDISIADPNFSDSSQKSTYSSLPELANADELVYVNFDQVDIRIVLQTISEITGINFIVSDSVRGTVTVLSPTTIRLGEIYKVLEAILEVKGYAAVYGKQAVKILPKVEAMRNNVNVRVGADPSQIPPDDTLVTQIIPLRYANATEISEIIKPLLAQSSYMSIYPRTNSILITDTSSNIHHVAKIIQEFDVQQPSKANDFHVIYLRNAQADDLAKSLATAMVNLKRSNTIDSSRNIHVTPDLGTNSLLIMASPQDFDIVSDIVEKLDIVREQVSVEMLIMEVSEDGLEEIGIDWATLDDAVSSGIRFFGSTNFGPRVDYINGDLEGLAIGVWKETGSGVRIGTILAALQKVSGVNILSTPHILTTNHQKARIIVGENRPFVTESRITETTDYLTPTVIKTYEYKDVGIMLEITPHISPNGWVRLEIDSEFSKLIEDVSNTSLDTPTTAKRQAQTVVSMNSGSTVVIGGLIRDDKITLEKKVPLVGDIPVVGNLFKYHKDQVQKTNLIMFITPTVITSQDDLEGVTEKKKNEMKSEVDKLQNRNSED